MNRRSFVESIGLGLVAAAPFALRSQNAHAQLVYSAKDWNHTEFDALLKHPAQVKQVYDIRPIGDGKFLNNVKNSLNGFQFGFGVPQDQIKVVCAMHGPSNMLNFDDDLWEKYRLGEWLQVNDPKTGKPATRNIYFRKHLSTSPDPNNEVSRFQDTSIETLQGRGVSFLSCHTATEEQVRVLIKDRSLKESPEEIVKDFQSHVLPGVAIVPAMVASVSLLQSEGKFTYITV
jgi:intracellular sulfur oxidation DsrE/DsrF family protein